MIAEPRLPWGVEVVTRPASDYCGYETLGRVLIRATQHTVGYNDPSPDMLELDRRVRLKVMRQLRDGLARSFADTDRYLREMEQAEAGLYGNEIQEEKGRT